MGTLASVIVEAPGGSAAAIADSVERFVGELDRELDRHGDGALGRLNATGSAASSPRLAELLRISLEMHAATGGAFDPSLGPLTDLWGFDSVPAFPAARELDSALSLCGIDRIGFSDDGVTLEPGSALDLGAIAPGYAADAACELAMSLGAVSALVDMGGEIRCEGSRTWRIAVRSPRGGGWLRVLEARSLAVSTSGDYESCFEQDGVRYSHILDPSTGMPARVPASVTVIARSAAVADALSTAIAVDTSTAVPESLATGVLMVFDHGGELVEVERGRGF
jgi:thiamine biosynthesis lipoprotein